MLRYQLSHSLFAYTNTIGQQLFPHTWPAIFTFELHVDRFYMRQERIVTDATTGLALAYPPPLPMLVIAARTNL
jgi:hypothetical protein